MWSNLVCVVVRDGGNTLGMEARHSSFHKWSLLGNIIHQPSVFTIGAVLASLPDPAGSVMSVIGS